MRGFSASKIKRITGMHPTRITIIVAELLEQGFLTKKSQSGVQVYSTIKQGLPNLCRYVNQQIVKKEELHKMMRYGHQIDECRLALLREALGDKDIANCGRCDNCQPRVAHVNNGAHTSMIDEWLKNRPFPISPIAQHRVSAGLSVFDSKLRTPLFVRFMLERKSAPTYREMDEELIHLLLNHFRKEAQKNNLGGIIPIPSRTWKAQGSILQLLSQNFGIPILNELLFWKEMPTARQGELLNNDQRHYNVHQKMEANPHSIVPFGTLILFDDYIGSGNTLKEAGRSLRAVKSIKNELIPFTLASIKWHLGKPGYS